MRICKVLYARPLWEGLWPYTKSVINNYQCLKLKGKAKNLEGDSICAKEFVHF